MFKNAMSAPTPDEYSLDIHARRLAYTRLDNELMFGPFAIRRGGADVCGWCITDGGANPVEYVVTGPDDRLALCLPCLRRLSRILGALDRVDAVENGR